jgi:hypothetical protein
VAWKNPPGALILVSHNGSSMCIVHTPASLGFCKSLEWKLLSMRKESRPVQLAAGVVVRAFGVKSCGNEEEVGVIFADGVKMLGLSLRRL